MKVRETTIEKYVEYMEFLQRALKYNPDAKPKDICKTFKVSANIPAILRELGVLARKTTEKGPQWVWIGKAPSAELAAEVAQKLHENCNTNKPKEPEKQAPLELEAPVTQMPVALLRQLIAEQQRTNALLEEMAARRRATA